MPVCAVLSTARMTDPQIEHAPIHEAIARIAAALARIERHARRPDAAPLDDSRHQALRARTQAALSSLETVIAQLGKDGRR